MTKKWKILGYQTNVEWYDVKLILKHLLRRITYSWAFQELICWIFIGYMRLVFLSSKKIFINHDVLINAAKNKKPLIVVFWHNRLMMVPFATIKPKQLYPDYQFMTLASRHGDGQFVGKIMEKFGLISISGSSNRKTSRGISIGSFKRIFDGLKKGYSLGITPDGPRGPNQKINGEIINIARISQAAITPSSYSTSRFKKLNTWDKFNLPLPFSTICFYVDKNPIYIPLNANDDEMENLKKIIEERMNFVQEKSFEIATAKTKNNL